MRDHWEIKKDQKNFSRPPFFAYTLPMNATETFSHLFHIQPAARAESLMSCSFPSALASLWSRGYRVAVAPLNGDHVSGFRLHIAHEETGRALTWGALDHALRADGMDAGEVVAHSLERLCESSAARMWWRSSAIAYVRTVARKFHAGDATAQQERDLTQLANLIGLCIYRPGSAQGQLGTLTRGGSPGVLSFLVASHLATQAG